MEKTTQLPLAQVVRYILAFELLLGGQARLTNALTPSLHQRVMSKANGTRQFLDFIPIRDAKQHTRFVGLLMCLAGALLSTKWTRLTGGTLAISLTLSGVYSQYKMGIPYWLPGLNTVLAGIILYDETH